MITMLIAYLLASSLACGIQAAVVQQNPSRRIWFVLVVLLGPFVLLFFAGYYLALILPVKTSDGET